jgi:hypothetical protein
MPLALTTKLSTSTWVPEKGDGAPIAVELCSGLGAIGFGLRALGFWVARAYDSWDAAVAIYNHNAPEPVATKCDLTAPDSLRHIRAECAKLGGIELLAAGPPCKGFSQIRNGYHHKEIAHQHNRILAILPEYVAALRPRFVLIENVPDLTRHCAGRTLNELKFDALFLTDVLGVYDVYRGSADAAIANAVQVPVNDPLLPRPAVRQSAAHSGRQG